MMMKKKAQSGAALLISLIFLLVLTVIGVASMNDTILQGKMAGAMQDSNVAFQGVETAIRDAEDYIESIATIGDFGTAAGLYSEGQEVDPFVAATWTDDNSRTGDAVDGLAEAPRYYIQLAGIMETGDSDLIDDGSGGDYSSTGSSARQIQAFKIIARSTGASGTSQRIVESYYGRSFQ